LLGIDMDTSKFVAAMTGQGNVTEPLSLTADVAFWNPNLLGASTEPGAVKVYYDSEEMCHGTFGSTSVGPRSTSTIRTDIVVQLNEAMAQKIMTDVMAHDFKLKVSADARVVVPVGMLQIKIRVQCAITAATLKVLSTPADVISKKACTYSYSL